MTSQVGYEIELCTVTLDYGRHEEQVDEVKLIAPCVITQITLTDVRPAKEQVASSLQAYARDLNSSHAARFAPLCKEAVNCVPGGNREYQTEVILTDHIVVRGRYSKLQISIIGFPDHDGSEAVVKNSTTQPCDKRGNPLHPVFETIPMQDLNIQSLKAGSGSVADVADGMPSVLASETVVPQQTPQRTGFSQSAPRPDTITSLQLPLPYMPRVFEDVLLRALEYFHMVHRSRSKIERYPPDDQLKPLMIEAYNVCKALHGDPSDLLRVMQQSPVEPHQTEDDLPWLRDAVDMAIAWSNLGSSVNTYSPEELQVGTAGVAASLLLCLSPSTCNAYMCGGGLQSLSDYLVLPELPSDIVRLLAGVCELVTISGGVAGCDGMLGWWSAPPPAFRPAGAPAAPQRPPAPGIVKNLKDQQEAREAARKAAMQLEQDEKDRQTRDSKSDVKSEQDNGYDNMKKEDSKEVSRSIRKSRSGNMEGDHSTLRSGDDVGGDGDHADGPGGATVDQEGDEQLGDDDDNESVHSERSERGDGDEQEDSEHPLLQDAMYEDEVDEDVHNQQHAQQDHSSDDDQRGDQTDRDDLPGSPSRSARSHADSDRSPSRSRKESDRQLSKQQSMQSEDSRRLQEDTKTGSKRGRSLSRSRSRSKSRSRSRNGGRRRRTSKDRDVGGPVDRQRSPIRPPAAPQPPEPITRKTEAAPAPVLPAAPPRVIRRGPATKNTYPMIVRMLCSYTRPLFVGAALARVLRRLHANELLARLQRASHQLLHGQAPPPGVYAAPTKGDAPGFGGPRLDATARSNGNALPEPAGMPDLAALPAGDLIKTLREAAGQLAELVDLMMASTATPAVCTTTGHTSKPVTELGKVLPSAPSLDVGILQLVQHRALLTLLPIMVSAGYQGIASFKASIAAANAAQNSGRGKPAGPSTATQQLQQQLNQLVQVHNQLVVALRALAVALTSDPLGLKLFQHYKDDVALLVHALYPELSVLPDLRDRKDTRSMNLDDVYTSEQTLNNVLDANVSFSGRTHCAVLTPAPSAAKVNPVLAKKVANVVTPAQELGALLCHTLWAQASVSILSDAASGNAAMAPGSSTAIGAPTEKQIAAAVFVLAAATCGASGGDVGRAAAVRVLATSPNACQTLLRLMRERGRAHRAAAGPDQHQADPGNAVMHGKGTGALDDLGLDDTDLVLGASVAGWSMPIAPRYARESLYASAVVSELVKEMSSAVLPTWAGLAIPIMEASRLEQEALLLGGQSSTSIIALAGTPEERARRVLREMSARAEVAAMAQDRGVLALVEMLDASLPALVSRTSEFAASCNGGLGLVPGHAAATGPGSSSSSSNSYLGSSISVRDVDLRNVTALLRAPERAASVTCALSLLSVAFKEVARDTKAEGSGTDAKGTSASKGESPEFVAKKMVDPVYWTRRNLVQQFHGKAGLKIAERAARTACIALAAARADSSYATAVGDDQDDMERCRNARMTVRLAAAAAQLVNHFLRALSAQNMKIKSAGLLDSLLKLHAQLATHPDSVAAGMAAYTSPTPVLKARAHVADVLGVWLDCKWEPQVLQTAFGLHKQPGLHLDLEAVQESVGVAADNATSSAATSGSKTNTAATNLCPAEMFSVMSLLGDLLPPEWPPQSALAAAKQAGASGGKAGGKDADVIIPVPQCAARRSVLLETLTSCEAQLRRLLSAAAMSESRAMRYAALRVVSRASGLGPSMPTFCVQPLLEPLTVVAKAAAGSPPISDTVRRVLEVVVPLSAKPSVKAGLLELRTAGVLARNLHHLVNRMVDEAPEGTIALAMVLEALQVLLNPDVALDPTLPRQRRLAEDIPQLPDLITVVTALLAALQQLTKEAAFVRQLLLPPMGLCTHVYGRQALRAGVVKWHMSQTGAGASQAQVNATLSDPTQLSAALAWAASRVKEMGERAARQAADMSSASAGPMPSVCAELSKVLDSMSRSTKEAASDQAYIAENATQTSAAARFTACLESAQKRAASAAGRDAFIKAGCAQQPQATLQLVSDPTSITYNKYVRLRGARAAGAVPFKKLIKYDIEVSTGKSAAPGSAGSGVNAASLMASKVVVEGITRRRRPRVAKSTAAALAAERMKAVLSGQAPTGSGSEKKLHDVTAKLEGSPPPLVPDIPVVTAPRRGNLPRRTGASGSRPASMHVDDYEKSSGVTPSNKSAAAVKSPGGPAAAGKTAGSSQPTTPAKPAGLPSVSPPTSASQQPVVLPPAAAADQKLPGPPPKPPGPPPPAVQQPGNAQQMGVVQQPQMQGGMSMGGPMQGQGPMQTQGSANMMMMQGGGGGGPNMMQQQGGMMQGGPGMGPNMQGNMMGGPGMGMGGQGMNNMQGGMGNMMGPGKNMMMQGGGMGGPGGNMMNNMMGGPMNNMGGPGNNMMMQGGMGPNMGGMGQGNNMMGGPMNNMGGGGGPGNMMMQGGIGPGMGNAMGNNMQGGPMNNMMMQGGSGMGNAMGGPGNKMMMQGGGGNMGMSNNMGGGPLPGPPPLGPQGMQQGGGGLMSPTGGPPGMMQSQQQSGPTPVQAVDVFGIGPVRGPGNVGQQQQQQPGNANMPNQQQQQSQHQGGMNAGQRPQQSTQQNAQQNLQQQQGGGRPNQQPGASAAAGPPPISSLSGNANVGGAGNMPYQRNQAMMARSDAGLYEDLYGDIQGGKSGGGAGGGSGGGAAQQTAQQRAAAQQAAQGAAAAAAVAAGGAGNLNLSQIQALLTDPVRMKALLQANPSLRPMLEKVLPPGFKLPQ